MTKLIYILSIQLFFTTDSFTQNIRRFDIVIDEVLADPSPSVGLPNSEYIEIRNTSKEFINLNNWKITDGTNTGLIRETYLLKPDSVVILCSASSLSFYHPYGPAIAVSSFPSLGNEADILVLLSPDGMIVHSISYSADWYGGSLKSQGGWSLEMIDPHNPCGEINNWTASIDPKGGSPGRINSVNRRNTDDQLPALARTYSIDALHIVAVFDEPIDSISGSNINSFKLHDNRVLAAEPLAPLFKEVIITLESSMETDQVLWLEVQNIADCAGNSIGKMNRAKAGWLSARTDSALIINEILFNPTADGYDYIELYNRSDHILDLAMFQLGSRNGSGVISNSVALSSAPFLLFPGEYILLTENKQWVVQHYTVKDGSRVLEISTLPSMPDDKGRIVLMDGQLNFSDEVHYTNQWHFALIKDDEGVALERIGSRISSQLASNWTSAASTAGYGTPGYINSHAGDFNAGTGFIEVSPAVFSPDNDGFDDFTFIQYNMTEPGWVANMIVYDAGGRKVKSILNNQTLSLSGSARWDGFNEKGMAMGFGNYIIVTQLFNLKGKVQQFKNVVSIAKKFR